MDDEECLRLLEGAHLGRIGITSGALPLVVPVAYALVGGRIVFRTDAGTRLDAATADAVVAFEVDELDPDSHAGWAVMVTGVVRRIEAPARLACLEAAGIPPTRRGVDHLVELEPTLLSGRRFGAGLLSPSGPATQAPSLTASPG